MTKLLRYLASCAAAVVAAVPMLAVPAGARAANAERGADLFDANCGECHSVSKELRNKKGPSLYGVVGRKSGSVPGFKYSAANQSAGVVWTPDVLRKYLAGPQAFVPGTTMKFKGFAKEADIEDVIAFLEHPE